MQTWCVGGPNHGASPCTGPADCLDPGACTNALPLPIGVIRTNWEFLCLPSEEKLCTSDADCGSGDSCSRPRDIRVDVCTEFDQPCAEVRVVDVTRESDDFEPGQADTWSGVRVNLENGVGYCLDGGAPCLDVNDCPDAANCQGLQPNLGSIRGRVWCEGDSSGAGGRISGTVANRAKIVSAQAIGLEATDPGSLGVGGMTFGDLKTLPEYSGVTEVTLFNLEGPLQIKDSLEGTIHVTNRYKGAVIVEGAGTSTSEIKADGDMVGYGFPKVAVQINGDMAGDIFAQGEITGDVIIGDAIVGGVFTGDICAANIMPGQALPENIYLTVGPGMTICGIPLDCDHKDDCGDGDPCTDDTCENNFCRHVCDAACGPCGPAVVSRYLDIPRNRYIAFDPANSGEVAFQVELLSSLSHDCVDDSTKWVDAPVYYCGDGRKASCVTDANCPPGISCDAFSSLVENPVTRVWDESVVYVTGCFISPVADYEIRASADGGQTFAPSTLTVSTIYQPGGGKWWGDTVGHFNGFFWTPPQGIVNIDDAVAGIKSFQQLSNAPHKSVTDVEPQVTNQICNISDVYTIILAFQGKPYPYGCPKDPCQDNVQSPCEPCESAGSGPSGGGSGPLMGGGEAPLTTSTMSLTAVPVLFQQNEVTDVEVYLDAADDLGGYQLALEVTGGDTGTLDLEDQFIDTARSDYAFYSISSIEAVDANGGRLGAVSMSGSGIGVTSPVYLGTFRFRASSDAVGVFTVGFQAIDENFLMDGDARQIDGVITNETYVGSEVECTVDAHCDDANPCTDDTCDNGTCLNTNNDANGCTDGNDCTADACVAGVCTSTNEPVNTPCDDGLFCTKTDKCDGAGVCVGTGHPCTGLTPYCCEYTGTCTALPCI